MSNGKTVLALLAGVGAGVALGYWFASERNDKLRKKIGNALSNVSEEIQEKLMNEFAELKERASELKDKGASMKDRIMYALKDMKEEGKQKVLDFIEKTHGEANKLNHDAKQTVKQL